MSVVTICYKRGIRMDEQYYVGHHVPLVERVWGALGLERTEVRKLTAAVDGFAPHYQIIFSVYFPSLETAQAALQDPTTAQLLDDIKNYYEGMPDIILGEIVR